MCDAAACKEPYFLACVPNCFKTQNMCDKAVRKECLSLQFVPDWFVTQQQTKIWHDNDDHRLIKWYEGYKKQVSIKKELLPLAWHPSRWWDLCVPEDDKKETEKKNLTIWYPEIKNVLVKEDVEIWSKRGYSQGLLWTKTNNWYIYNWCKQVGDIW